jgi:hypothetical protein
MPRPAPVTMMDLPSSDFAIGFSRVFVFLTSPRLRGEVGWRALARDPGEGNYPRVPI